MRYAVIKPNDIANGEGINVSLYTQGCPHHCEGCFNQETWDYNGGKEFKEEDKLNILKMLDSRGIKRNLSILGGEALSKPNIAAVIELCGFIKKQRSCTKIYVWSGYTYEQLIDMYSTDIFKHIDVLIDGKFEIKKKDVTLKFRGSSNQRVIDIQKTLEKGEIVSYI